MSKPRTVERVFARPCLSFARAALLTAVVWMALPNGASAQSGDEGCFAAKANAARAAQGLGQLANHQELISAARRHSQEMAAASTIYHNSNLGAGLSAKWLLLGENVGMGPSCDSIHEALMNSPGHRANILESRYNFVGMGTVASNGTIFVTQMFMQAKTAAPAPAPPAPAPSAPAAPAPAPSPKPTRAAAPRAPASPRPPAAAPSPSPSPLPPPAPPPAEPSVAPTRAESSPTAGPSAGSKGPGSTGALVGGTLAVLVVGGGSLWYVLKRRRT